MFLTWVLVFHTLNSTVRAINLDCIRGRYASPVSYALSFRRGVWPRRPQDHNEVILTFRKWPLTLQFSNEIWIRSGLRRGTVASHDVTLLFRRMDQLEFCSYVTQWYQPHNLCFSSASNIGCLSHTLMKFRGEDQRRRMAWPCWAEGRKEGLGLPHHTRGALRLITIV